MVHRGCGIEKERVEIRHRIYYERNDREAFADAGKERGPVSDFSVRTAADDEVCGESGV